jgi:hypothetical protein
MVLGSLVLLLCAAGLVACGGGDGEASMRIVASEEKAEIGKAIQFQGWQVMVTKPSEKLKLVGKGEITYQPQGIFVIVFVKVTNLGKELQMIPRDLFRLRDAQGREFEATQSAIQIAYILPRGGELLLDSPMDPEESRESIIIYDVPGDATGLMVTMEGTEETLDLGF